MACVNLLNIGIQNNPAPFSEPFTFEITFECFAPLAEDLEWKVTYVGSAEDTHCDQELLDVLVGPVPVGLNRFVLEADAPELSKIPPEDRLGVTAVIITCLYKEKEFIRIGYYVNNEYTEQIPEGMEVPPPTAPSQLRRNVLVDQPRVTRFPIPWDS